jgi:hypothetical protein
METVGIIYLPEPHSWATVGKFWSQLTAAVNPKGCFITSRFSSEAESADWAPPPIPAPRTLHQQNCATSFQNLVYKPPNNHQAHRVDLTPPCFVPREPCDPAFISLQYVGYSSALSALLRHEPSTRSSKISSCVQHLEICSQTNEVSLITVWSQV